MIFSAHALLCVHMHLLFNGCHSNIIDYVLYAICSVIVSITINNHCTGMQQGSEKNGQAGDWTTINLWVYQRLIAPRGPPPAVVVVVYRPQTLYRVSLFSQRASPPSTRPGQTRIIRSNVIIRTYLFSRSFFVDLLFLSFPAVDAVDGPSRFVSRGAELQLGPLKVISLFYNKWWQLLLNMKLAAEHKQGRRDFIARFIHRRATAAF